MLHQISILVFAMALLFGELARVCDQHRVLRIRQRIVPKSQISEERKTLVTSGKYQEAAETQSCFQYSIPESRALSL